MSNKRQKTVLLALLLMTGIVLFTAPFLGMKAIPLRAVLATSELLTEHKIFWSLRIPRVLVAFLAGGALALSGMCFQALFRNALATPFTLGVSSGASLGAAICVRLGVTFSICWISGITLFAFFGALLSILLVYGLTRLRKGCPTSTMLLAGVAVSFFFSSLILFMQYISDFTDSFRIIRWLMGGVEVAGYKPILNLLPFVLIGCILIFYMINELNLLTVSEDFAISRGLNLQRTKSLFFLGTSLMIGGVVAICGPIGFVGMICPHICRLLIGPNHRYLTPATLLFGGSFLVLSDTLARTIVAPAEIPVGVITALLGGPFFLWLLIRGNGDRGTL